MLRKLRGITQRQLADRTHFAESLVKKVEQGSVPPSAAFVAVTARVLQVKPAYLYGAEERASWLNSRRRRRPASPTSVARWTASTTPDPPAIRGASPRPSASSG
jgi:transcriptional regulator with XRE-family HTH domain